MKKSLLVIIMLVLATTACMAAPTQATPTPVPPLPTEMPTPIPATAIPPTALPPTTVPPTPTNIPTTIPPTAIPPTVEPTPTGLFPDTTGYFIGSVNGSEIIYEDDFLNPKQEWQLITSAVIKRSYVDGEFLMHLLDPGYDGWNFIPDVTFTDDVILDVDVRAEQNAPDDFEAGFVCGLTDNDNFYGFGLGPDGWMEIFQYKDGERLSLYSSSDVVPLNPAGTHLTAVCTLRTLALYADSQLVGSADILDLPAGTAGLFSASYAVGDVKIYFDNFKVSKGPFSPVVTLGKRGTQLLSDDFADNTTGWDVRTNADGSLSAYEGGKYRMKVLRVNYDLWSNPNDFVNTGDVIVDVDVTMGSNPFDNSAAIICNYDVDTNSDFSVAGVDGKGFAQIYEYVGGEVSWLFTSDKPITLNPQVNHLTVHCIGSSVAVLVNNRLIGSAVTKVGKAGNVGLLTGSFENIPADFLYDNFEVYSVQ